MTNAPSGFNFAHAFGIHSVAGAVIFAILYVALLSFFVRQAISRSTNLYLVMAFFCSVRIAAFILRAFLAGVASAGQNLKLLIAFEVVYNVGFFGLLYSAYGLVLDRGRLSDLPLANDPISRLTRKPFLFRLVLTAAVAVGITGAVFSAVGTEQSTIVTGNALRKVSIYMFLVLSILVAFQTVLLVRAMAACGTHKMPNVGLGATYGMLILCAISLLLLAREAFFVATVDDATRQNNEYLWYPFSAVTEFAAVVMFTVPGLVPSREELPS